MTNAILQPKLSSFNTSIHFVGEVRFTQRNICVHPNKTSSVSAVCLVKKSSCNASSAVTLSL